MPAKPYILIIGLLISIFHAVISSAAWVGPKEIIKGSWGSKDNEFGITPGDMFDTIPVLISVDETGNIIIGDRVNGRIKIYNSAGTWERNFTYKSINPLYGQWPEATLKVKANAGIFSIYEKLQKYDYNGNLIWAADVPGADDFWIIADGSIWLLNYPQRNKYYHFSVDGKLIDTSPDRPLELGRVNSSYNKSNNMWLTVVQYNDMTYSVRTPLQLIYHMRDTYRSLYGIVVVSAPGNRYSPYFRVYKFDTSGSILASVDVLPYITNDNYAERKNIDATQEYGRPVIAPNGDVFTWNDTSKTYSVIKWTWVNNSTSSKPK